MFITFTVFSDILNVSRCLSICLGPGILLVERSHHVHGNRIRPAGQWCDYLLPVVGVVLLLLLLRLLFQNDGVLLMLHHRHCLRL